ncbi:putative glycosidase crf1 [Ceratocystis lukuohia]
MPSLMTGIAVLATSFSLAAAQTWTTCNPLKTNCPTDPALAMSIDVDFTKGAVNSFYAGGTPSYVKDGVEFSVTKSGDAPQLNSAFYIMFGRVEVTMKAAPGTGIVSSVVLQSDDLDEIDFEWLGGRPDEVQLNYFGKGIVSSYNRGTVSSVRDTQNSWHTYTIDWTSERIIWAVDGTQLRSLKYEDAETNQYPQTPMQVKFGSWSGGDPGNAAGTIAWAGGNTDYSKGPYTMMVKSILVADYSTGTAYNYTDNSGSWQSIQAIGGKVNGRLNDADKITITSTASSDEAVTATIPIGIATDSNTPTYTQTGWPWVAGASPTRGSIPAGWYMTPEGKIMRASAAALLRAPALMTVLGVGFGAVAVAGGFL